MKEKIKCLECGKEFGIITEQHLKICCNLTLKQYKEKHPNVETISEKVKYIRKSNCNKINKKTKRYYCVECNKNYIEKPISNHWKYICDDCKYPKYLNKIYLPDQDLVVCQICWQAFEQITWMHTKIHDLTLPEYRKKFPKGLVTNKGIRETRRIRNSGDNNPAKRKDIRKKISISQTFTSKEYIKKYPWVFPEIEKIRDYLGIIEVQCKNCKNWFHPINIQITERLRALCYGSDGCYFYCTDNCKGECPLYRLNPLQYLTEYTGIIYTDNEYQIFREEVLNRQKEEYGSNVCEICGSENNLHVHHEKPQKTHPHMSLDPDNGIVLCEECHFKKAHKDSCSSYKLSKLICKDK